jgi:GMP synthase (glutamine-hydrolysing)
MTNQIAILDFGSQYTHLIARRIRQIGVFSKIYSPDTKISNLENIKGIILSGGPQSVKSQNIKYNKDIFNLNIPVLGLCYGHQLIAHHFGGKVKSGQTKEYGTARINLSKDNKLFENLKKSEQVWMSHGDSVVKIPKNFIATSKTSDCPVASMANMKKNIYGLQFHPEVTHTTNGLQIIENFVLKICKCQKNWSMNQYWKELESKIKKQAGNKNVFLLVSGGVDSTVCFALLEKILGKKKVFGLHIDNGFLRHNESNLVKSSLNKAGFSNLKVVNTSLEFLNNTKNIVNPEKKREIIGKTFLDVKDRVMKENNMKQTNWILAQGTIYPDTIESGSTKHADKIKTHHNRVKEILKLMKAKQLIEPLSELYKDEVRKLGYKLKLPKNLLERHPFPGPGLAIRTLCSNGKDKVKNKSSLDKKLKTFVGSKINITSLPLKSVGVQGDNRTYNHPALISGNLNWKYLSEISPQITNKFREINRVVYLVKPNKINFKNFKIKKAYLTKSRLELLRQTDKIVMEEIKKYKIYKDIWQFPVVLAPLSINSGETIILRPIQSIEAMTINFYQINKNILNSMASKIIKIPEIDMVLYDITNKPPGTIEWE